MPRIGITGDYIKLDQFLKLAGAVSGGGEAKTLIQGGLVKVNGQMDTRRGKKLKPGDRVEFEGLEFKVEADPQK